MSVSRGWIQLVDVNKAYRTPAGMVPVLKDISLGVEQGEFVAIIGKSGSGKSTLLNMLTGIDRPTTGEVWVGETSVHRLNESQMARWRGKNLGIVFQFFQLVPTLTLLDNVMLPMDFAKRYTVPERTARARMLLERVGMTAHADKLPLAISGGQQQRVAIARALANDPPLLVADEPTGNLDSPTAESIFNLFTELVGEGKTIIMVTHDNEIARRASRTVVVADGEIVNSYVAQALTALDIHQLSLAATHLAQIAYPPGAVVIRQGEPADKFYIVVEGELDVFLTKPGGDEIVVNHLLPGNYFGETALVQGGTRTASVRAWNQTPVALMALDRETFHQLSEGSPALKQELDRIITMRLQNLRRASVPVSNEPPLA